MRYKILINFPNQTLVFKNIDDYELKEDGFIRFFDKKTKSYRQFDRLLCEIIEESEDGERDF